MLPLTADESICTVYMHCVLSAGQSLLRAYSRSCLLCFSCVPAFCTQKQVSTPQSLRCTSLLSTSCYTARRAEWQMRVSDERPYPAVALFFTGRPGAWQYDCALLCSWGSFPNSCASKVHLTLALSRAGLVQTDAGLSWEIATCDTASPQRPEQSLSALMLFLISIPGRH